MSVRLPPFKSIEAFVVAAQVRSFTAAAETLHITVPAISRRIQALEAELGVQLFNRTSRMLALTPPGETYLLRLAPALEAIRGASERIRGESRRNSVKVSMPPSFASNWLVPRLPRFYALHRSIQIDVRSWIGYVNFDDMDVDLAIQRGTGTWPALAAEPLLDINAYPVCSLDFLARNRPLHGAGDLAQFPLLGFSYEPDLWAEWFHARGLGNPPPVRHVFDNLYLLYQAAASGLGIALGLDVTVKLHLDEGRVVRPIEDIVKLEKSYYLVGRPADRERRAICTFRNWLLAEAARWRAELSPQRKAPSRSAARSPAA